ncbi:MAG: chitobiase/beta-hexosaminidase C-terminal domain-containing protein [Kiritimatiellaeota bacterium]|nr:chitobiase/beta-hexosaminidase C-terminal domain-containing protein [Kiritimatiellota bacterium]
MKCVAGLLLLAAGASAQMIELDALPELGSGGNAEGRVVWNGLNAGNAGQYAVIGMLDTPWGQYVKPSYENYLNAVDANGFFSFNLTSDPLDYPHDDVLFYFVERALFNGVHGSQVNAAYMVGKHLAMLAVKRSQFGVQTPTPSVAPGFVPAGTAVALSCAAGDTLRYTTDGTAPTASSPVYSAALTVPQHGALIIHAIAVRTGGAASEPASFTYLPRQPLDKPFFGLNASLILGGENPGGALPEAATRTRLAPAAPLAQWVRTFGTLNNGHEHVNRIAKTEMGLRTLIGLWVSTDPAANAAQLQGLRDILTLGPAPDLIAVGNECNTPHLDTYVPPATLTNVIAAVRGILAEHGLGASVPVGSVDIGNAPWPRAVLTQLDFAGVNIYCGTWDATPQHEMAAATARLYTNETARLGKRMTLLTETGTPHDGGPYSVDGGTQTASQQKSADYLNAMLDWTRNDRIPLFHFSLYDEAWKTRVSGRPIEQYFGLLDAGGALHPFYAPALDAHRPPVRIDGITVTPAAVNLSWSDGNANCAIHGKTNLADAAWVPLAGLPIGASGVQFNASDLRFFRRMPPE